MFLVTRKMFAADRWRKRTSVDLCCPEPFQGSGDEGRKDQKIIRSPPITRDHV